MEDALTAVADWAMRCAPVRASPRPLPGCNYCVVQVEVDPLAARSVRQHGQVAGEKLIQRDARSAISVEAHDVALALQCSAHASASSGQTKTSARWVLSSAARAELAATLSP